MRGLKIYAKKSVPYKHRDNSAFVKKTNKTPANALKIARTRLQEMIENDH